MDDWKIFNNISLPQNEKFYIHLKMEIITDADYAHAKRFCKDFKIQNMYDLYIQSDTLLLANIFENLRNICVEIYELDPVPELTRQASLKKTKGKLDLLSDIDMLLMVEKGIRGGICIKANNKYIKNYDKNKESSYLQYWDINSLYE